MESVIRINKFLSQAGVCSRRAADALIEAGAVSLNGRAAVPGELVSPGDRVEVNGRPIVIQPDAPRVYLAFHKPAGIVTTAAADDRNNIIDYIDYPTRIYPVGRLDQASRGLIFLTNDGDFAYRMAKADDAAQKEYWVRVDGPVTPDFIRRMAGGVEILGKKTNPCPVDKLSSNRFRIILNQGMNRQIRRMCEACGRRVVDLLRVRINTVRLADLKAGAWRDLSPAEVQALMQLKTAP